VCPRSCWWVRIRVWHALPFFYHIPRRLCSTCYLWCGPCFSRNLFETPVARGAHTSTLGRTTSLKGRWRLRSGPVIGASWVAMGAFPAPVAYTGSRSVAIGASWGSRGAGPSVRGLACAGPSVLAGAVSRGWKSARLAESRVTSEEGRVWLPTFRQGHIRAPRRGRSVARPLLAPTFRAGSRGAGCPCGGGPP